MIYLLDANIILRYLLGNDPRFSPKAEKFFYKLGNGDARAFVNMLTLHEVLYVLENIYGYERDKIIRKVVDILGISTIDTLGLDKKNTLNALELYAKKKIDWADFVLYFQSKERKLKVATSDRDIEKIDKYANKK